MHACIYNTGSETEMRKGNRNKGSCCAQVLHWLVQFPVRNCHCHLSAPELLDIFKEEDKKWYIHKTLPEKP